MILAISVSWFMDIRSLGTKEADPSFLAIQLTDIILFPVPGDHGPAAAQQRSIGA